MTKTLSLLRHGKDALSPDGTYLLTPEGHKQADSIGAHLCDNNVPIDRILYSGADRAQQTLERIQNHLGLPEENVEESFLLQIGRMPQLVEQIQKLDKADDSALLIGHNPAIKQLADLMTQDGPVSFGAGYDNGVLSTFSLPIDKWSDFDYGQDCELIDVVQPNVSDPSASSGYPPPGF